MSVEEHLYRLLRPPSPPTEEQLSEIEKWYSENFSNNPRSLEPVGHPDLDHEFHSPTLERLHSLFIPSEEIHVVEVVDPVDSVLGDPKFVQHRNEVMKVLSSQRNDNNISGELAELLGFEHLDLVTSIIRHRKELLLNKGAKKTQKTNSKASKATPYDTKFSSDAVKRRMEEKFREAADRPLWSGTAHPEAEVLPHVYTSASLTQNHAFGAKYLLPIGTDREYHEDYEEVTIPPAKTVPPRSHERLIPCSELPPLARGSFLGYTTLNRIQSIVYATAFKSNENMLICAPTGAGKTDVAMLSILRVIDQYRAQDVRDVPSSVRHKEFKIIYVAPMKALASEIVRKLGKRLAWLHVKVRELTGDMQLTKAEIAETQIIVTTPEKWDVVTRKPTGEGELATKVKLLIIDEVHLLNDERGAVIETIVARTVRQVESTQSLIRIVGLSATLPNYIDVADFLRVSRQHGLFFFDSSFRPVPLEQHFIGIKGKAGGPVSKRGFDKVAYQQVSELVREGHQVMVFVHTRKDTVKSALSLKEMATQEGDLDFFSCQEDPQFEFHRRDIGRSKNKEMKELFDSGFGIHHAGMLRADRNLMERLFEAKTIKVLCCTATLAWGVNLPAHGVIIKGTQLYDPSQGKFVDISVLDVLQIFGRAGRPGMETSGVGYILTSEDKLQHYLEAVTAQHPIESKFITGLMDSLNAEISLGTVTNVAEGAEWIGYTYLFVRMRKNPMVYGLTHEDPVIDPDLLEHRQKMITIAAKKLAIVGMIQFDEVHGSFVITDVGRIAAKYYIRHASIEIFQKEFRPKMTEADVLALLAMSTEFDQIQVRENEVEELKALEEEVPCQVKGGTDTSQGKVNILLQAHISKKYVEDFALVSDTMYAAQNGGRIIRALLEIALSRKWANSSAVLMAMSKTVEKRMWGFEHPLGQFELSADVLYNLGRWADELEISELASMTASEVGTLIHLNEKHGAALLRAAKQFPKLIIRYRLRPLSNELLKICVSVTRDFEWSTKIHGGSEPFWVWVEDHSGINIIQLSRISFGPNTHNIDVEFIIPIPGGEPPPYVQIKTISDRWVGSEDQVEVLFDEVTMPADSHQQITLIELPLLSVSSVFRNSKANAAFDTRFSQFNSMQTQCFWSIYHTERNALVTAPTSSGKSILAQAAVCRVAFLTSGTYWAMIVVPRLRDAKNLVYQLRDALRLPVDLLRDTQDVPKSHAKVRVITASCLFKSVTLFSSATLKNLRLVVCEDLELLDDTYEMALSLLFHATQTIRTRRVGFGASLIDADSLASWLGVPEEGNYNFPPTQRDQSIRVTFHTFTIPYSAALFKAMAKPLYDTIRSAPREDGVIVFVPSRGQCKPIVSDLLTQCAVAMNLRGFLGTDISQEELEPYALQMRDEDLAEALVSGISVWHEGMSPELRTLILRLFAEGIIRVLVAPREACWSIPVRAGLVVVMGTQYIIRNVEVESAVNARGDRQLGELSLHELVRMQGRAARHGKVGRFHILCQAELRDAYMRFLTDGLPLESQLLSDGEDGIVACELLQQWVKGQRLKGTIKRSQDVLDFLGGTFLALRIGRNPSFYDVKGNMDEFLSRLVDDLWVKTTQVTPAKLEAAVASEVATPSV